MGIFKNVSREQSGSDSYNRFEYQVSYTFKHLLDKYQEQQSLYIFCEFHDDFIQTQTMEDFECIDFFQVKTKELGKFTYNMLFNIDKGKKHSMMGYVFYNFLHFSDYCNNCFFIINSKIDSELQKWQKTIHNKEDLAQVNQDLYNKMKTSLEKEFSTIDRSTFNKHFQRFISYTYILESDLDLKNHNKAVHSDFINMLKFEKVELSSAQLMFDTILNNIRTNARYKVPKLMPKKDIIIKKAISTDVFDKIKLKLQQSIHVSDDLFNDLPLKPILKAALKKSLNLHREYKLTHPNDTLYIEEVNLYIEKCESFIEDKILDIMNGDLESECTSFVSNFSYDHPKIRQKLLEALFYEIYIRTITT